MAFGTEVFTHTFTDVDNIGGDCKIKMYLWNRFGNIAPIVNQSFSAPWVIDSQGLKRLKDQ